MKSLLLRSGSGRIHSSSFLPESPRGSLSLHDSLIPGDISDLSSPRRRRISLHLEVNRRSRISRAVSDPNLVRSGGSSSSSNAGRLSGSGSFSFPEEVGFPGGGIGRGRGRNSSGGGGGSGSGSGGGPRKMGEYYQEMLKSNPTDCLLLGNYAKFLHKVERDAVKAEEYYGRAILASRPGECDGEVLSMYGSLIWETHRDGDRARYYFDQAVAASPNDCTVLGSYARFMWEAEDEEDDDSKADVQVSTATAVLVG